MDEETSVIQQNWFTLCETPLFIPLKTLCEEIYIQLSTNLQTMILSILEGQIAAYAQYTNDFPFIGCLGVLFILQFQPNMESNSQYQRCVKQLTEASHFESLFGFVNLSECSAVIKWLGYSDSLHKQIKNRLNSKIKYLPRMNELIIILNSINTPNFRMSSQTLIATLVEAFSLIQRISLLLPHPYQ